MTTHGVRYDLRGKVALVTGAASGIGHATALAFARAGAHVMLADLDPVRLEAATRDVSNAGKAAGANAAFVRADVSNAEDVRAMVAQVVATFGGLDYAFN